MGNGGEAVTEFEREVGGNDGGILLGRQVDVFLEYDHLFGGQGDAVVAQLPEAQEEDFQFEFGLEFLALDERAGVEQ